MPTDVEMTADFDDKTPTAPAGSCWRCEKIDAVFIVAPAPGSSYEALRLPTCIATRRWAWCGADFFLRLGDFEIYLGPDRREAKRIPFDTDRRRPRILPRQDDEP